MKGSAALLEISNVVHNYLEEFYSSDMESYGETRLSILQALYVVENAMLSNNWAMDFDWNTDSVIDEENV